MIEYNCMDTIVKKLLILGNGFDLQCGLNSRYNDFYKYLIRENKHSGMDNPPWNNKMNIVWALLYSHGEKNCFWKDIEEILNHFLFCAKNAEVTLDNTLKLINKIWAAGPRQRTTYPAIFKDYSQDIKRNSLERFVRIIYRSGAFLKIFKESKSFEKSFDGNHYTKRTEEEIYLVLKKDLTQIENEFAKYIENEVNNKKPELDRNANYLYFKLTGYINYEEVVKNVQILNFNYTRLGIKNNEPLFMKNIHGIYFDVQKSQNKEEQDNENEEINDVAEYESPIIFGIDYTDNINPERPFYKFTKTFRVSVLEVENNENKNNLYLNQVKEIIIYGHSLNNQDYSYFHAIFNVLNLNTGDVKIIFCYSDYDKKDRSVENLIALQKLIDKYEKDFNIPRGLYQRLMMENRIEVRKIK